MTIELMLPHHLTPPNGQQDDALRSLHSSLGDHADRKIIVERVDDSGNVVCMNVEHASFSTLPPDFAAFFPALESLGFYSCKSLNDVSPLSGLKKLAGLILMFCPMPETIGDLVFLKSLSVYYPTENQHVPRSIGNLVNTRSLRFNFEEVTELPREMGKMDSLKNLDLGHCGKLESIPAPVLKLPCLEAIRLDGCNNLCIPSKDIFECSDSLMEVQGLTDSTMDEETREAFDLVVRWSKARRHLRGNTSAPQGLWSHVLGRCSHDTDCLLFFLKQKPDLCKSAAGRKRKHNA